MKAPPQPRSASAGTAADGRGRFLLARWLVLRLLASCFALAFGSFLVQARGLCGAHGILPLAERLPELAARLGAARWLVAPSLLWLDASDTTLVLVPAAGIALAGLLALGLWPRLVLASCAALYLSLANAASPWLDFQWDGLLVEAAWLALPFAPAGLWRPGLAPEHPPARSARWLLWWLVVRLMLGSGLVKLASGDPSWRELDALSFHWWTQPLPGPLAYFAWRLPDWAQRASTAAMFAVELVLPAAILLGRRGRALAASGFVALMLAIGLTGSYGFFHLLAVTLSVALLDDAQLARLLPARARGALLARASVAPPPRPAWRARLLAACALVLGLHAGLVQARRVAPTLALPAPLAGAQRALANATRPLQLANAYGLFAVMTKRRVELVPEASMDGTRWLPYRFRWKPDRVDQRPRIAGAHLPRLDWLLWFAALSPSAQADWLAPFLQRLLEASPDVLALLEDAPFGAEPPRFVRLVAYDYRFASPAAHARGAWWERERLGVIAGPLERAPAGTGMDESPR